MAKKVTVEVDEKGRVHIPLSIRRELKSRRFTLWVKNGRLLMEPVKPAPAIHGKYKALLKANLEQIEEDQERFVASDRDTAEAVLLNEKLQRDAPKGWESSKAVREWRDKRR